MPRGPDLAGAAASDGDPRSSFWRLNHPAAIGERGLGLRAVAAIGVDGTSR
jgi:hypothetical protein